MNIGHVQNGTNAGWRRIRADRVAWSCSECGRDNAKHLVQCLGCGARDGQ